MYVKEILCAHFKNEVFSFRASNKFCYGQPLYTQIKINKRNTQFSTNKLKVLQYVFKTIINFYYKLMIPISCP